MATISLTAIFCLIAVYYNSGGLLDTEFKFDGAITLKWSGAECESANDIAQNLRWHHTVTGRFIVRSAFMET